MSGFGKFLVALSVVVVLFGAPSFFGNNSGGKASSQPGSSKPVATASVNQPSKATTQSTPSASTQSTPSKPTYPDSRWLTNDSQLLAIPESDRWYNAHSKIGSYGTIAGPVMSVHQATGSKGQPVFINIGEDYPNSNRAQVVIWAEQVPDCLEMLQAIDHGDAWISITGYISLYDGVPEINFSDGPVSWTYWTH